jgi:hypothetical protein
MERRSSVRLGRLVLVAFLGAVLAVGVSAPTLAGGRPLTTALTGAAERPGPGDPDASGTASITLNHGQGEVCFALSWEDIDGTVSDAHIHQAPAGTPGPIVVPLFVGASFASTGSTSGCISGVSEDLIKDIRHDPAEYYVNIHSTVFPAGAIRGQLG